MLWDKKRLFLLVLLCCIVLSFSACRFEKQPLIGDFPNPGEDRLDGTYLC